jgi:hypothetical protein
MINGNFQDKKIINIGSILLLRQEKQAELAFYRSKLIQLENRMGYITREIQLTQTIIDLVERECIVDLGQLLSIK